MPLTGEAKKKYQRDLMAQRRSNKGSNAGSNKTDGSNNEGLTGSNETGGPEVDRILADLLSRVCALEKDVALLNAKQRVAPHLKAAFTSPLSREAQAKGVMPYVNRD